jgi:hypothetical protein
MRQLEQPPNSPFALARPYDFCHTRDMAEIDKQAGGNRTAFMVAASLERVRTVKRERLDRQITESLDAATDADIAVYRDWEATLTDGLDESPCGCTS